MTNTELRRQVINIYKGFCSAPRVSSICYFNTELECPSSNDYMRLSRSKLIQILQNFSTSGENTLLDMVISDKGYIKRSPAKRI
jgi:hypothetical protein